MLLVGVLDKMVIDRDPAMVLHWSPSSSQVWRWLLLWLLMVVLVVVIHVIVLVGARHVGSPWDHTCCWAGSCWTHVIWMELRAHRVSRRGHQVSRLLTDGAVGVHHTPSPVAGSAAIDKGFLT